MKNILKHIWRFITDQDNKDQFDKIVKRKKKACQECVSECERMLERHCRADGFSHVESTVFTSSHYKSRHIHIYFVLKGYFRGRIVEFKCAKEVQSFIDSLR